MATVKDVVCGMEIDPNTASSQMEYQGKNYHFCSMDCHTKFIAEPQKYAEEVAPFDVESNEPEKEKDMATVKDVVCGMDVDPNTASHTDYEGQDYHFCSSACHEKFMADPRKYDSAIFSNP